MFRCNNFCSLENRNITKLDPCSIFSLRNSNLKLFIIFSRYIWVALFYKTIVSLYPCFFKIILYHLIMSHYIFNKSIKVGKGFFVIHRSQPCNRIWRVNLLRVHIHVFKHREESDSKTSWNTKYFHGPSLSPLSVQAKWNRIGSRFFIAGLHARCYN